MENVILTEHLNSLCTEKGRIYMATKKLDRSYIRKGIRRRTKKKEDENENNFGEKRFWSSKNTA